MNIVSITAFSILISNNVEMIKEINEYIIVLFERNTLPNE